MAEATSTQKIKEEETSKKEVYSPSADEQALIEKWKKRFTRAEEYLRPYRAKWLRMYKHYRAYQEKTNYAYQTRLMPPIAFQIVETVASRLATAKRKTRILPRDKKDVDLARKGDEAGILFEGNIKIEKGDIVVAFVEERKKSVL